VGTCAQSPSSVVTAGGSELRSFEQNSDPVARRELLAALPPSLLQRMVHAIRGTSGPTHPALLTSSADSHIGAADSALVTVPSPAVTRALVDVVAEVPQPHAVLRHALASTVRSSSGRQALAGLLTAGLGTAARYVGRKMSKAWMSRTRAAAALPGLM
jgi:Phosphatidate cytidylyltransferase, mitochondrial